MGYINNLVEQDGVKVLLVANESEILRDRNPNSQKDENNQDDEESENASNNSLDKKSIDYIRAKEKTISDTLLFTENSNEAIKDILLSFGNSELSKFSDESHIKIISNIMSLYNSRNLRSLIFACQKTIDIYDILHEMESVDFGINFEETVLYSIISFSLEIRDQKNTYEEKEKLLTWKGNNNFSYQYGYLNFPLFRFCFDYIIYHKNPNRKDAEISINELKNLRVYDKDKTRDDPTFFPLFFPMKYREAEITSSIDSLRYRLHDPEDISFYSYSQLCRNLIELSHILNIDISDIKDLFIKNLRGRENFIDTKGFFLPESSIGAEFQQEYSDMVKKMKESLKEGASLFLNFQYQPEKINDLYSITKEKMFLIDQSGSFLEKLNISKMVDLFFQCTPSQMEIYRSIFQSIYNSFTSSNVFNTDKPYIEKLLSSIETNLEAEREGIENRIDKIQQLHCGWFVNELKEILYKF